MINPISPNNNDEDDTDLNFPSNFKAKNILISLRLRMKQKIERYVESLRYTHKRTKLMKTPCKHIFHNICLEKWLEFKNECPYCRREIPPLE